MHYKMVQNLTLGSYLTKNQEQAFNEFEFVKSSIRKIKNNKISFTRFILIESKVWVFK